MIITLVAAKTQLNITSADHDEELTTHINAAGRVVEHYIGPVEPTTVTEISHPRGSEFLLSTTPVTALTDITPVYSTGITYDIGDLDVDSATGVVRHRLAVCMYGPLRVTYQAGRSAVPPNADLAARIIVQHLWQTRRGGSRRPGMSQSDDIVEQQIVSVMGYAIPRRAVELLQPDQTPGIA